MNKLRSVSLFPVPVIRGLMTDIEFPLWRRAETVVLAVGNEGGDLPPLFD